MAVPLIIALTEYHKYIGVAEQAPSISSLNDYRDYIDFPQLDNVQLPSEDFWPSDSKPQDHKDAMTRFLALMEPVARFLETAAFAIPEYGVLASGAVGLLWGAIQPGTLREYQDPVAKMIGNILESKLQKSALTEARSGLDQFNSYFKDAVAYALPKSESDVSATVELAKQFKTFVDPGGLLNDAFYKTKDNLPWFDSNAHSLLVCATQTILQAHIVQLRCWQSLAYRARNQGDLSKYNEAQREVCYILDRLKHHIPDLKKAVELKIADMMRSRLVNCVVRYKTVDINLLNRVSTHRDYPFSQDSYRISGWVHDPDSERDLLHANAKVPETKDKAVDGLTQVLFPVPRWFGIAKPDGSKDDIHFGYIMDQALHQYRERLLQTHIEEPFADLTKGIDEVLKDAQLLDGKRLPGKPQYGPVFIQGQLLGAPNAELSGVEIGTEISYRYTLHISAEEPELQISPWSETTVHAEAGKIQPVYIGDGYAAMETVRKIYRRTSTADDVGKLVATIKGRGVMSWPDHEDHKHPDKVLV